MPVFEITKQATFDAAHHFPNEPEGSIYRRVHGHSFTVEATVTGYEPARAQGRSRQEAEKAAAVALLKREGVI